MNLDFLVLLLSYKASSTHYKIYKKKKKIIHSHSSTWDVAAIKTQAVVLRVFSEPFMVLDKHLRCKALKF
jgi:hypothetical protein